MRLPRVLSVCLAAAPMAAYAQTAPTPIAPASSDDASAAQDVGEIVVTASKREQRLQDVPSPISVMSGSQLEAQGVTNVSDLTRVTTGLVFNKNGGWAQPTIRGIGTRSTSAGDSSSVAIYIDGVYLSAQQGGFSDFNNVERVEVLKGPQGTLFGRNATGGAISIVTREPSYNTKLDGSISYESYNRVTAKAYGTTGLSDTLAADVAVFFDRDDGYVRDIISRARLRDMNNWGVRSKLRWEPSSALTVTLSGDYGVYRSNAGLAYTALNRNVAGYRLEPAIAVSGERSGDVALSFVPEINFKQKGVSLKSVLTQDVGSLTSITSYRDVSGTVLADLDATNLNRTRYFLRQPTRTFTQEFYGNTRGTGMFSATAGLFFLWEQAQRTPNLTTTTTAAGASSNSTITVNAHTLALAPYAEVTTHLGEKFDVILGARYSYERRALKNYLNGAPRVNASASFRNVDYRATAQYKFSRQLQVYATASTGFKSGVFNTSAFDGNAVRPEKVKAYEVGFKSSTGPIKLSGDVFYYDYRDIQVTLSVDPRTGQSGLQNAARAHIKGAEFEAQGRIVDGLTANLGATYLHAVYKSFPGAQILIPIAGGGNANGTMDASGQPVVRSPKLTLTAGLNYETAFAGGLVNFNGSFYHTSSFTYEPSARVIQPAYDLLNGSIGWSPVNKKFGLTVYAENITKKRYYENLTINTTGDIAVYAPPRRIGVRLNFSL